jgi:glutathione peroxidase
MDRRETLRAGVAGAAAIAAGAVSAAGQTAYGFTFEGIDGGPLPLSQFGGRVLLVVNTASRCGFTDQYAGLQRLWTRYRDRGLVVIGVPSNDFGGQEPGSDAEIRGFCSATFGVTFPLAARTKVRGEGAHPFYRWAAAQRRDAAPRWNFHKLLVDRRGRIAEAFASTVEPGSTRLVLALELALAAEA